MDPLALVGWPVLDRIGPVSPHGIGIALGYLAGSWWMLREGRKRGVNEDHAGTILLWALIGAILGARIFYVLAHLEDYTRNPADIVKIWEGGISLIGGITGAIILAYPFMRRYGYRFLQVMDSAAIGLAFGIIIGRIGDLIIGDHLGKPTDFALGWQYKGGELPGPWFGSEARGWAAQLEGGLAQQITPDGAILCRASELPGCPPGADVLLQGSGVHQTALYDFLIVIGLFFLLRWLNRVPRREGVLIMTFAIVYGLGRVGTDLLRVDKTWFGLTGSQWASIAAIAVSLFTLWRFSRRSLPQLEPLPAALPEPAGPGPVAIEPERSTTEFEPPAEPSTSEFKPNAEPSTREFEPPARPSTREGEPPVEPSTTEGEPPVEPEPSSREPWPGRPEPGPSTPQPEPGEPEAGEPEAGERELKPPRPDSEENAPERE